MGTNNQKQHQLLNEYKFVINKHDIAYGEVSVYQKNIDPSKYMAVIRLMSNNPQKQCQLIKDKLKHPNMTEIFDCFESKVKDFCGTLDVILIGIEYIQKSLIKDMEIRKKLRTSYFEGEIWYLLKTLCLTMTEMQQNKLTYLDLHPQNIRITEEGCIKLLDLSCTPHNITSLRKVKLGLRDIEYLTPEQLLVLKEQQNIDLTQNFEKINIFILGVISLVCVTNIEAKQFYNQETNLFEYGFATTTLKQCVQKFKYSQQLEKTILNLLNYNPFHRPTYDQLLLTINGLDAQIISDHFYMKCSSQTARPDSSISKIQTEIRYEKTSQLISEPKTQEKYYENDKFINSPSTLNVGRFLRTKPTLQRFSLTPDSKSYQQQTPQTQRPQQPNYSYYDPQIESALRKSQALISYCNNGNINNSNIKMNSSSVSKYTPIVASLNVKNEDQSLNYFNVQQLIQQAKNEPYKSKSHSKSFTYQ